MTLAEQMRDEFDRSFTEPVGGVRAERRDFVLVDAGGMRLALPVQDLRGIEHGDALVAVPSRVASLLGVVGVQGAALPVFGLGDLLGGQSAMSESWKRTPVFALVEAEDGQRLGLGFERLVRFVRVKAEAVLAGVDGEVVSDEDELFEVVRVGELVSGLVEGQA